MLKKLSILLTAVIAALTACVLGSSLALAQPQVEIELIGGFGGFGRTEPGTFNWPVGIAIDDQGRLIIADNENNRMQRCSIEGDCEVFGKRGSQLGDFLWPLGVAVDSLGRIIVSEAGNHRIQLRDSQGDWTSFGSHGHALPGEFDLPAGIAVDDQDRIIIADELNHRIQICDDAGSCSAFGSRGSSLGSFDTPRAVGVTSQGTILVADFWNHRVQICSYEGECTAIGSLGAAPGQFVNPSGVVADSQDRLIISDVDNYRFQICDLSGACVAFGEFGTGPGQFRNPQAVAVDDQNRIYVGDAGNHNIQIFQATYADDPPPPDPFLINAGLNGNWWNGLDRNGEGVQVEVSDDGDGGLTFVATIYSYNTLGNQIFLIAVGTVNGDTAEVEVFITQGGQWGDDYDPAFVNESQWGTGTFTASSCEAMHMALIPNAEFQGMGYTDLMYDLMRLTTPVISCPL
jgi:streptogramin lyase